MAKDEINAFLGTGTVYDGKLDFQGSVRIDGTFTGEITSEGTLIVGKEAKVQGNVHVGQVIVSGNVQGTVTATQKTVLHRAASLSGTLHTGTLVIEEGAMLQGEVSMGEGLSDAPPVAAEEAENKKAPAKAKQEAK